MEIKSKTGYDFALAKKEYREFCKHYENDIPVFGQPWFLDAACDSIDDWQVIVHKDKKRINAAFPFEYVKTKSGWYMIRNPFQAKRLGLWVDYGAKVSSAAKETFENKMTKFVIENLPLYDVFHIEFDARYQNWREFYNNGFSQETRYSYILPILDSKDEYLKTFNNKRIKEINQTESVYQIERVFDLDRYCAFLIDSYKLRNRVLSYSEDKFKRLVKAVFENRCGEMYFVKNENETIVGERIYFKDSRRTYEMFGTFDPRIRPSCHPLITCNAIIDAGSNNLVFDFEGSMDSGVATYNREFGGLQEPYFVIKKHSEKYQLMHNVKEAWSLFKNCYLNFNRK